VKFRHKAFGLHLSGSATALTLVLGAFWLGWYRWPGWYLASALEIVGIVVMVDLVLGPTLTLIVANPGKPRRELTRDITIIVVVQLIALAYGGVTLWSGRPLYYTFSGDRLEIVQASDLKADDINAGRRENPDLAPYWYRRPQWIWAPLPENPDEAKKIAMSTALGGADVIQMPRLFRPWERGLPELRRHLRKLDELKSFAPAEKSTLKRRLADLGLPADQPNTMIMWGGSRRLLAVFDSRTLALRALLEPN